MSFFVHYPAQNYIVLTLLCFLIGDWYFLLSRFEDNKGIEEYCTQENFDRLHQQPIFGTIRALMWGPTESPCTYICKTTCRILSSHSVYLQTTRLWRSCRVWSSHLIEKPYTSVFLVDHLSILQLLQIYGVWQVENSFYVLQLISRFIISPVCNLSMLAFWSNHGKISSVLFTEENFLTNRENLWLRTADSENHKRSTNGFLPLIQNNALTHLPDL